MPERLYRLAGALIALAIALYVTARVVKAATPQLIIVGVIVAVTAGSVALHRYRRTHW